MNNVKISELNSLSTADSEDLLPIVDVSANETKKISVNDIIPNIPFIPDVNNSYSTSVNDTYSCDHINNMNTYSTTEIDTGKKWIDGKSIYRKVTSLVIDVSSPGDHNFDAGLSNVDTVTDLEYNIGALGRQLLFNSAISALGVDQNSRLYMYTNVAWDSDLHVTFIFEYTKTTD